MGDFKLKNEAGKFQRKWIPATETLQEAKLLKKAGLLNLIVPFGFGVYYLGKKMRNENLKKRGMCQLAASLLLVGICWSVIDGLCLREEGQQRRGSLTSTNKENDNETGKRSNKKLKQIIRGKKKKKDSSENEISSEADTKHLESKKNDHIGPHIETFSAAQLQAAGSQTPIFDREVATTMKESENLPETLSNHVVYTQDSTHMQELNHEL